MRQYRREAVNCEAKMFERRRERYSNLLLQVMSVMDRIQVRGSEYKNQQKSVYAGLSIDCSQSPIFP